MNQKNQIQLLSIHSSTNRVHRTSYFGLVYHLAICKLFKEEVRLVNREVETVHDDLSWRTQVNTGPSWLVVFQDDQLAPAQILTSRNSNGFPSLSPTALRPPVAARAARHPTRSTIVLIIVTTMKGVGGTCPLRTPRMTMPNCRGGDERGYLLLYR
jgi:hypothetical protein